MLIGVWRIFDGKVEREFRLALVFCALLLLIPILQLIPLPPSLWAFLPGRDEIVTSYRLLGLDLPWRPITMTPDATWFGALSLLPPLALFLGISQLSFRDRRRLSLVVLAVGITSLFVGLLQVAQGPASPLRFYEVTNPSEAVGFFANRNHFSALLYSLLLLTAAWTTNAATAVSSKPPNKAYNTNAIIVLIVGFTVLVALLGG
ncbi:unnamed protein product, partial [marine sediment metagenome]